MINLGQLHKNTPYKNELIPYSITRTIMEDGLPDILFHWHTDMEIIYVHEGQARFHIDTDYFNSEIGYSTKDFAAIHYLHPLYNGQLDFKHVIKPNQPAYKEIRQTLINSMEIGYYRKTFFELELKSELLKLLHLLFQYNYVYSSKQSIDGYRREEKIRKIIDYISEHYQEDLSIKLLAELCGYSPTHFMNFFKKNLGVSCMDYLIHYRLRKATELLQHSTLSVLEIASSVGFSNLSNFNRQFKKVYKTTPRKYREEMDK